MNKFLSRCAGWIGVLILSLGAATLNAQTNSSALVGKAKVEQNSEAGQVMRIAISDVLSTMRGNESLYRDNPQKLHAMIEKTTLPYLYIKRMTQLAMGKNWKNANDQQRQIITHEFQTYLMRSYIRTLYVYRNVNPEIVEEDDLGPGKAQLKVRVTNQQGNPVLLFVRLEKPADQWQILDVSAEGVSLIVTARGLFNDEIAKKGMDGFIQALIDENQKAALNGSN